MSASLNTLRRHVVEKRSFLMAYLVPDCLQLRDCENEGMKLNEEKPIQSNTYWRSVEELWFVWSRKHYLLKH